MKGMDEVTSLLNKVDESSVSRWSVCIHELASIVSEPEFEEGNVNSMGEAQRYHEDCSFSETFHH